MAVWSLAWSYAGHTGTVDDVDPSVVEELDLLGSRFSERRVRLSISLDIDVAALVEARHPLTTATGVLLLNGEQYMSGRWSEVSYGALGEEITLTLTESASGTGVMFPPGFSTIPRSRSRVNSGTWSAATVDGGTVTYDLTGESFDVLPWEAIPAVTSDTQSDYPSDVEGRTYPFPFGAPGTSSIPGSPGIMIEDAVAGGSATKIMISGRPVPPTTGTVTLWGPYYDGTEVDATRVASQSRTVLHEEDAAGRRVAYVTVSASSDGDVGRAVNGDYYVSWTAGGATSDGTAELVATLMMLSGVRVNVDAIRALSSILDRYQLDWYTDKSSDLWEMLRRGLLPMLPVAWVPRRHGWTPVLMPVAEGSPEFTVTDGDGFHREGSIRYERVDIENRIEVEYAWRPDERVYSGRVVLASNEWPESAESEVQHGTRSGKPLRLDCVWDRETAVAVGRDRLNLRSQNWRRVSGSVDPETHGAEGARPLKLGQWVTLSIPDLGMSRPAVVTRVQRDGSSISVRFLVRG